MTVAYVGLGSNLGDREAMIAMALAELARVASVTAVSSLYETAPWGKRDQPAFLNCCASLDTALDPEALLSALLGIETRLGRIRGESWGPRTIDLDLLLYGDESRSAPGLIVPHPLLTERAFVLVPLAEIAPSAPIPGWGLTVSEVLSRLPRVPGDVRRFGPAPRPGTAR